MNFALNYVQPGMFHLRYWAVSGRHLHASRLVLLLLWISFPALAVTPVPVKQVRIDDTFWAPKLATYKRNTIPHSWQYMQWNLRALRAAAGEKVDGDLNNTWDEANLYKFLETAGHSLGVFPDKELERQADEIIALIARAQRPDGYAHAFVINSKKEPWDPGFLDGSHDGYVLGHLIEAAIEYHANTGKRAFLEVARRAADQAWEHFLGPNGKPGFCGHAGLEMALVELYRVTGEKRYLELSRAFVEWRGQGKVKPFGDTPRAYFQDGAPLRQQKTLDGHAVRAIFFATGVADIALESGDADYRLAANRFWDSTVRRRMAITGSIGPRPEHEAFGEDFEIPDEGYYESCAACGLAGFAQRIFLLEKRAEHADVLERVLYNAILHGISLDGTNTYYRNPLSDTNHLRDNCWVCCPPNLSRTLFQVGRYAYASDESNLWVNLYIGGNVTVPMAGGNLSLGIQTGYPWEGNIAVTVQSAPSCVIGVRLRLPGWCEQASLAVGGVSLPALPMGDDGYITLRRQWKSGDKIELSFSMPVRRIEAHPNIRTLTGQVALQRGPIVYGFEAMDNNGTAKITLGAESGYEIEHRSNWLGGVTVIKGKNKEGKPFLAIPFYVMANREKTVQEVWAAQTGVKQSQRWWLGELYRPAKE